MELTSKSSENTPLLRDSPEEPVNGNFEEFSRQSIFTCAIVCILFAQLCWTLTTFSIIESILLFATNKDHLGMNPHDASILALMFGGIVLAFEMLMLKAFESS